MYITHVVSDRRRLGQFSNKTGSVLIWYNIGIQAVLIASSLDRVDSDFNDVSSQ